MKKKVLDNFIYPLKTSVKRVIRKWFDSEYKELRTISKKKRFENHITMIFKEKFEFVDSASFLFIYQEVFGRCIYKFKTNNKKPYIIDCGANIGLSVCFFKKFYPDCEILAFEPDPSIFKVLEKNVNSLKMSKVTLINKALWDKETLLDFSSDGADGGRIEFLKDNDSNFFKIPTISLSQYLNRSVDFLKIDIEGAELVVLKDIEHLLENVNKIFIEYHSFKNEQQRLNEILEILTNNKFRYYIEHIGVSSEHPFENIITDYGMDNQLNIFAYK